MRTVLGYRDGHTLWSDNTPSEAWSHDVGGSQIVTKSIVHSKPEPKPPEKKLRGTGLEP